jgi:hypothetical protein
MKNLLIGSRALSFFNTNFKVNENTDWDIISINPIKGSEWHKPDHLNNYLIEKYASDIVVNFNGNPIHVVNMEGLSIIKRSHLWRDLSFQKHITHYHKHITIHVPQYSTEMYNDYRTREILTLKSYERGHPNLNQPVKDFFNDYVTKKYDHDYLHELVAYYNRPLYTRMQKDPSLAWCNQDLWLKFTDKERQQCVAEETYVIAIERFMVPNDWNFPSKLAYIKALDKVCTTLTSGWFRAYAIDNYPVLFNMYSEEKFNRVKESLNDYS